MDDQSRADLWDTIRAKVRELAIEAGTHPSDPAAVTEKAEAALDTEADRLALEVLQKLDQKIAAKRAENARLGRTP